MKTISISLFSILLLVSGGFLQAASCAFISGAQPLNPKKDINYEVYGQQNKEAIVLIHGLDGSMRSFDTIKNILAQRYKVIMYDQRGHGNTKAEGEAYNTVTMANDLGALLDFLNIDKVRILGHSMGGRTAIKFASLHPKRVKALVVEDMDLEIKEDTSQKAFDEYIEMARKVRQEFKDSTFRTSAQIEKALKPYFEEEAKDRSQFVIAQPDGTLALQFRPDVSLLYYYLPYIEDLNEAFRKIECPILFLRADTNHNWSAMSDEGVRKIEATGKARVKVVPWANHSIHAESTVEFLNEVLPFLEKSK